MTFDAMAHLKEMMKARGVGVHAFSPPYEGFEAFDGGLRKQMYEEYDYANFARFLETVCRVGTVFLAADQFELNYVVFKNDANGLVTVGPYVVKPQAEMFREVCERLSLPVARVSEIRGYLDGVPAAEGGNDVLESEIILLAKYVLDTETFGVERIDLYSNETEEGYALKEDKDERLPMAVLEELYLNEDALLGAVERGDLRQATMFMGQFTKFRVEQRHPDSLRNLKNFCLTLNSLLRKAVQRAAVHPAHIDHISKAFAVKIENARIEGELSKIDTDMLHKYCQLVNNYSLRTYSLPIRKAINYIDFNYMEQIGLDELAKACEVNASYLSSLFKKETGLTVVDYSNLKRVQKAMALLASTKLPISVVAGKCGFMNDNYFAKTFKKQLGKTPREYRVGLQG